MGEDGEVSEAGLTPDGYGDLLAQLKAHVRGARLKATRAVNTELLVLYWNIGRAILDRQDALAVTV